MNEKIIAVAGNPNVGKSTLFNSLTGLKQHTGNWAGKTIDSAQGHCQSASHDYQLIDIPGTYSLVPHSGEEEVACDFLYFGDPDGVAVVCDATCLERGLNLLLQMREVTPHIILCVNLMDEAKRQNIELNLPLLENLLGIPVIGTVAHCPRSKELFLAALDRMLDAPHSSSASRLITYAPGIEEALSLVMTQLKECLPVKQADQALRWLSLMLLEGSFPFSDYQTLPTRFSHLEKELQQIHAAGWELLKTAGYSSDAFLDSIVTTISQKASEISNQVVAHPSASSHLPAHRRLDKLLTGPFTAYPVMLLGLLLLFWLTITGANYPSQLLSDLLFGAEKWLDQFLLWLGTSAWLRDLIVCGIYRTTVWVISVMLPPMAIFFPLFALLEDIGILPRIAYNLDYCFQKCHSCGKQALTMAMGFGCNGAGIIGCRIIDSPRERLIAILTNCFVPCNGRFPLLIALVSMFFVPAATANQTFTGEVASMDTTGTVSSSLLAAACLTLLILLSVLMTFFSSALLSATILKGVPSSFTLELPPFRRPRIGNILLHSFKDKVSYLLVRAIISSAPAGLLLWLMANISIQRNSLLGWCAGFLDSFARLLGLDGVILMAFILGLPANEIVLPIILMAYSSQGSLQTLTDYADIKQLLVANGWTWTTAVSTCLFSLMHWPCATTLLTIHKETGGMKWTLLSILLPVACGCGLCMIFTAIVRMLCLA